MDDLIAETTQGRINGTQSGAEEEGKVLAERGAVRTEVNPDQLGKGLREVGFRQIREQAAGSPVVDCRSAFPIGVAGDAAAAHSDPRSGFESASGVCAVAPVSFSASQARAWETISDRGRQSAEVNCFNLSCQLLGRRPLQLQHVAQLVRSGGASNGIQPAKLLNRAAVHGATDVACLDKLMRLEQLAHRLIANARQSRRDGQEGCSWNWD
jgi:hypothetical protein